jgi:hypothetical protein
MPQMVGVYGAEFKTKNSTQLELNLNGHTTGYLSNHSTSQAFLPRRTPPVTRSIVKMNVRWVIEGARHVLPPQGAALQ